MRRDQAPKANVDLTRKAMSVENINKLKPVLMKNINLNQKVRNISYDHSKFITFERIPLRRSLTH